MWQRLIEDFVTWFDWMQTQSVPVVNASALKYLENRHLLVGSIRTGIIVFYIEFIGFVCAVLLHASLQVTGTVLGAIAFTALYVCATVFKRTPFAALLLLFELAIPFFLIAGGYWYFINGAAS